MYWLRFLFKYSIWCWSFRIWIKRAKDLWLGIQITTLQITWNGRDGRSRFKSFCTFSFCPYFNKTTGDALIVMKILFLNSIINLNLNSLKENASSTTMILLHTHSIHRFIYVPLAFIHQQIVSWFFNCIYTS